MIVSRQRDYIFSSQGLCGRHFLEIYSGTHRKSLNYCIFYYSTTLKVQNFLLSYTQYIFVFKIIP